MTPENNFIDRQQEYTSMLNRLAQITQEKYDKYDFVDQRHMQWILMESEGLFKGGTMYINGNTIIDRNMREKFIEKMNLKYLGQPFWNRAMDCAFPNDLVLHLAEDCGITPDQLEEWSTYCGGLVDEAFGLIDTQKHFDHRLVDDGESYQEAAIKMYGKITASERYLAVSKVNSSWTETILGLVPAEKKDSFLRGIRECQHIVATTPSYKDFNKTDWELLMVNWGREDFNDQVIGKSVILHLNEQPEKIVNAASEIIRYLTTFDNKLYAYLPLLIVDFDQQKGKIKSIEVNISNNEETKKQVYELRQDWNLTTSIDGSASHNRSGEWFKILKSGRISLAITDRTKGGRLLDGAEVWEEFEGIETNKVKLSAADHPSKFTITRDIPTQGQLVVYKPPQEWRFSLKEE